MTNLKFVVYYLNFEMIRNRQIRIIRFNQIIYLRKIMIDFNMFNFKKTKISMNSNLVLELVSKKFQIIDQHKICYQSIVDFFIYLMFETRSDIAFVVFQIFRFSFNSIENH